MDKNFAGCVFAAQDAFELWKCSGGFPSQSTTVLQWHHVIVIHLVAKFLPSKPRQHQHKAPRDDHRKRKARLHMSLPALPRALQLYDLRLPLLTIDIEEVE